MPRKFYICYLKYLLFQFISVCSFEHFSPVQILCIILKSSVQLEHIRRDSRAMIPNIEPLGSDIDFTQSSILELNIG